MITNGVQWLNRTIADVDRIKERYHYRLYLRLDGASALGKTDGGAGSGYHNHASVKGRRGGSAPRGYSLAKEAKTFKIPCEYVALNEEEIEATLHQIPVGAEIKGFYDEYFSEGDKDAVVTVKKLSDDMREENESFQVTDGTEEVDGTFTVEDAVAYVQLDYFREAEITIPEGTLYPSWMENDFTFEDIKATPNDLQVREKEQKMKELHAMPYPKKGTVSTEELEERMEEADEFVYADQVDDALRGITGDVWKKLDKDSKMAICGYTEDAYRDINNALRTGEGSDSTKEQAQKIMDAIAQCPIPKDMWLRRGMKPKGIAKMLGVSESDIEKMLQGDADLDSLVGKEIKDNGFMSCGSTSEFGFDRDIVLNIFAQKGTRGMYVEPVSSYGKGDGITWNGESKQRYYSDELETVLQAGTTVQITSVVNEDGKLYINTAVIQQDPPKIS